MEFLKMIVEMIMGCFSQGRTEEEVKAEMRAPSQLTKYKLEREIRKEKGLNWREWAEQRQQIMARTYADLEEADEATLDEIIADAKQASVDWSA